MIDWQNSTPTAIHLVMDEGHWVKHGMEWNGMDWNGMEWNGLEWNGMEWIGMEWNSIRNIFFSSQTSPH